MCIGPRDGRLQITAGGNKRYGHKPHDAKMGRLAREISPNLIAGFYPWQPPSPQILHKPWIANYKPAELTRRHPVQRKVGLNLIQKIHRRLIHISLVFLICSV